MKIAAASVLAAFAIIAPVQAQQPRADDVFGLQVGAPPSLPPCSVPDGSGGTRWDLSRPCLTDIDSENDRRLGDWRLSLPRGEEPEWFEDAYARKAPDGAVDSVLIRAVRGASDQAVMAALTKKYGKPSFLASRTAQNGFGAKFEATVAQWRRKSGAEVIYVGALDKAEYSVIRVLSKSESKREDDERKRTESKRREL
jgi:hypothetical protein